jgi:hypothetical protein
MLTLFGVVRISGEMGAWRREESETQRGTESTEKRRRGRG